MPSSPSSRSLAPELPLKYVGGDTSLDFINTVDWTPGGLEHDRLSDYGRLLTWAKGARVISTADTQALRQAMAADPDKAKAAYQATRWTRWVLHETFYAAATRQPKLLSQALPEFNRLLARAHEHLDVSAALKWRWRGMPEHLESVLWPVVRAAASLLTSSDAGRLRMCTGPDCGWLYVDRSRNGLRRWCEMQTCGTLAKSRRRAARRHLQRIR